MILIYTHTESSRLQYICSFIFKEQLGVEFRITLNEDEFREFEGPRLDYSNQSIPGSFNIEHVPLLFEKDIRKQPVECFQTNGYTAFYKISNSSFAFDVFAASFFLISRYEEYLPHKIDMYGRYAYENSIAYKNGFLSQPLVNTWIIDLAYAIQNIFPSFQFSLLTFNFLPTYDIDIAWSYKHKGFIRNAGGFYRSPSSERVKVLLGMQKDPFDSYELLDTLHEEYRLHPIYFFLVADSPGEYDKNITRNTKPMVGLIQHHAQHYSIGLHPSWKSYNDPATLKEEKNFLEDAAGINITNSRQHYIKFSLPDTYEQLSDAGILNEYSMGYGSINGFRASISTAYYWYDLRSERPTPLRIHPFCFMDANSHYEQKQTVDQSFEELMYYYKVCKEVNGTLITIFHNNFLGNSGEFKGWKEMYERFMKNLTGMRTLK